MNGYPEQTPAAMQTEPQQPEQDKAQQPEQQPEQPQEQQPQEKPPQEQLPEKPQEKPQEQQLQPPSTSASVPARVQSLIELVRVAVAVRVQTLYDAVFADMRSATSAVSDRIAAISDLAASVCMRDESTDDSRVSLPVSHLAFLDAARLKAPAAYAALVEGAASFEAAPPISRRKAVMNTFDNVEAALPPAKDRV